MTSAAKPQAETYPPVAPGQPLSATARTSSSSFRIALIIGVVVLVAIVLLGSVGIGLWIWFGSTRLTTASIAGNWNCEFIALGGKRRTEGIILTQFVPEVQTFRMTLTEGGSVVTGNLFYVDGRLCCPITGTFANRRLSLNTHSRQLFQLALSPDGLTLKGEYSEDPTWTVACTRGAQGKEANQNNATRTSTFLRTSVKTTSGLRYKEISEGTGPSPQVGQIVSVHYTGTLEDGSKFDSSPDRGQPLEFRIGTGAVLKNLDEGLMSMKVGDKRKLIIPAALGYGERGSPPTIPPNAILIFNVELLSVS